MSDLTHTEHDSPARQDTIFNEEEEEDDVISRICTITSLDGSSEKDKKYLVPPYLFTPFPDQSHMVSFVAC